MMAKPGDSVITGDKTWNRINWKHRPKVIDLTENKGNTHSKISVMGRIDQVLKMYMRKEIYSH